MDVPAFNILPLELSVNKARILSRKEKEENKWVNVMALSNNKSFMKIDARIEGDQVKGHRSTVLYGQEAVEYQANAKHKQDSLVSNPENKISSQKEQLTVTNLKVKKQENDWALIEEEFDFVLQVNRTDNHLYINPMLFPQLKSNPFISDGTGAPHRISISVQVHDVVYADSPRRLRSGRTPPTTSHPVGRRRPAMQIYDSETGKYNPAQLCIPLKGIYIPFRTI